MPARSATRTTSPASSAATRRGAALGYTEPVMNAESEYIEALEDQFGKFVLVALWENSGPLFLVNLTAVVATAALVGASLLLGLRPALVVGAFTAYPCMVGLMAASGARLRRDPASTWQRAWDGIRGNWFAAGVVGLALNGAAYTYMAVTAARAEHAGDPAWTLLWAALGAVLLVFALCAVYSFPLMALYPKSLRSIVRNSLLLAVAAPLPTFAMLGLTAMLVMPVLWIGWGIFLFTPIVVALFWAANCDLQVARRQVKP